MELNTLLEGENAKRQKLASVETVVTIEEEELNRLLRFVWAMRERNTETANKSFANLGVRHRVMLLMLANRPMIKEKKSVCLSDISSDVIARHILVFLGPEYCRPREVQQILRALPVIKDQQEKIV